jgi:putative glutathione S-transferase
MSNNALMSGAAGVTTDDQTNAAERRAKGEFVRGVSSARNWISTAEGGPYPPAKGRYHMYVAYNCPWCHRVLLARAMLGLEDVISVDVLYPNRSNDDEPLGGNLWKFCPEGQEGRNGRHMQFPECTVDTVLGKKYAKEIYELAGIDDQKSVPILFDKETNTVVSNESAEIVRMLGTVMKEFQTTDIDMYPSDKAKEIDAVNDWIYKDIANGSYKAGFSSDQDVYETAYETYFQALEKLDDMFQENKFLTGDEPTEADLRLMPPLFRHDPVYYNRFKLNKSYLWDYKHVWRWMGDMMSLPGMESVTNAGYLAHCKQGYFGRTGNGTIPVGPEGYPECYMNAAFNGNEKKKNS